MVKRLSVFWLFLVVLAYAYGAEAAPALFIEFTPPPKTAYIGQEIPFRIRLWDVLGVTDVQPIASDWENVDVFMNSRMAATQDAKDGRIYDVRNIGFSLIIKTAGKHEFQPFCLSLAAPALLTSRQIPNNVTILRDKKRLQICTESFEVVVSALPKGTPPLFPAQKVELYAGVIPQATEIPAGTPIKRSIILLASGTLPVYLSDFILEEQENIKMYAGKVERTMTASDTYLVAGLRQTVIYVPGRQGEMTLPEMKVSWFNTQTQKVETSVVPPYSVRVTPPKGSQSEIQTIQAEQKVQDKNFLGRFIFRLEIFFSKIPYRQMIVGVIVLALGGLLALLFGIPLLHKHLKRKRNLKELYAACQEENPERIEKALITWAKEIFSDRSMLSLSDVRQVFAHIDPDFKDALGELELRLYGMQRFAKHLPDFKQRSTTDGEPLGAKICRTFDRAILLKNKQPKEKEDIFPELYPKD